MKKKGLLGLVAFCGLLGLLMGKPQTVHGQAVAQQQQINKNFMVYYRAWRDKTMQGVNTSITDPNWLTMDDIPYGVNIVNVFSYVPKEQEALAKPYFDKLKGEYADRLHARGVKLVRGFDYSKLTAIYYEYGANPTEEQFDLYAQELLDELMTPWKLDGLDIDMETNPSELEVKLSDGVIKALSKYIGPKANNGTLFLYDSNAENMDPFKNVVDVFDQVPYQQYGAGANRTKRAASAYEAAGLPSTKFMPGLTFPEEQDPNNRWYDTDPVYTNSNIYNVAKYSRDNNLSGMFLYAFDRDGKTYNEPDFSHISPSNLIWTKTAIQEVNGWSLDSAKELAEHHLQRIRFSKELSADTMATATKAITAGQNLYEVNEAIMGKDYDSAISPTYDPVLENNLLTIDLTAAEKTLTQAQAMLATLQRTRSLANVTDLQTKADQLAQLIGGKEYTQAQVDAAVTALQAAITNATGKVTVNYHTTDGQALQEAQILTGAFGSDYDVKVASFDGYTLQKTDGDLTGKYDLADHTITFTYAKNDVAVANGNVIVRYLDQDGKALHAATTLTGKIGAAYQTKALAINGYRLVKTTGTENGKFTEASATVTYHYEKVTAAVTNPVVKENNKQTKLPQASESKTTTMLLVITGMSLLLILGVSMKHSRQQ